MITWGILRNDSEMAYNPHHTHIFQNNSLGVEVGRISVIVDSMESILLVLTEQFHTPLSIEPKSPLHISPYNPVAYMPSSQLNPPPTFLQSGKHSWFGEIYAIVLQKRSSK